MKTLGRHILVEFYGCDPAVLNNKEEVEKIMNKAAESSGATIINSNFHMFSPYGVSGVVVISESHLAVHTWPEYGYAAVDVYTCGDDVDPWVAFDYINRAFGSEFCSTMELKRGQIDIVKKGAKMRAADIERVLGSVNLEEVTYK